MTYLYIITLHSASSDSNSTGLMKTHGYMTPGTDVWVDTRQKPFPRTEKGLVGTLVESLFNTGTKEVPNLQLRADYKPSDKKFYGVSLVKCDTLDERIPAALKDYYESILKIYPSEWGAGKLEVRVKICEIDEDQDLSSIVGVGSVELRADGIGGVKYKSTFAEPNFQESRIDEFIEYMGEIKRFNEKKEKFMKTNAAAAAPVEAFEPESKFAEEFEAIQAPAPVKKPEPFPEMNLRCKWKGVPVEETSGVMRYFSRAEPKIMEAFKEFTLFGGELSRYIGSAFCPEFEVEEIKENVENILILKALLSSKMPRLYKSVLESALACFPEPPPPVPQEAPLDEVVEGGPTGPSENAELTTPAPPTEMDAYFEHMFANVFLPEFLDMNPNKNCSLDVQERNHMMVRLAWLLFALCPKESYLSRLEPYQDTYMGKKPLPSWFSLNDTLFTGASDYLRKQMDTLEKSKMYCIKNVASPNLLIWSMAGNYFEWKGNKNAWDAAVRLFLMPQTMTEEQKNIILKSFCENCLTTSDNETTGSQTMYQSFLEWIKKAPLYSDERLKRIKGVIPIGEFSRLMKENGYAMTRRSAGMVYLKTKIKHTPASGSTTNDTTDILPGFKSLDSISSQLNSLYEPYGTDFQVPWESVEFKESAKKVAKSTEEILSLFNEREAEVKEVLEKTKAHYAKIANSKAS